MKWYSQAAQEKRAQASARAAAIVGPAEFKLGSLYERGLGVPKSKDEAIKWYTKSSNDGYPLALDALRALEQ